MKTTLELPDELYRQIKAHAALAGRSVKDVVSEMLREMLAKEQAEGDERGWRSVFGKGPKAAVRQIQRVVDDDLSRVDPAEWR